jgi:hypothetical protein
MEIPATNVDGVDEQHVVESHLENLQKQKLTWKTCRNKYQLENCITTIQSHGHSSR